MERKKGRLCNAERLALVIPGAGFRCGDFRRTGETNCHADCRFAKMKREGRNLNETETVPRRKREGGGGGVG